MREEIFGPCCGVIPFDSEGEVIALANDTDYGLCAPVLSVHLARAHRVPAALPFGLSSFSFFFLRHFLSALFCPAPVCSPFSFSLLVCRLFLSLLFFFLFFFFFFLFFFFFF